MILECSNFHRFDIVVVSWQKSSQGEVSLERVTFFVLDEADRMLEYGFEEQVGRIGRIHGRIFFESPGIWKASGRHQVGICKLSTCSCTCFEKSTDVCDL